jgi:hypothetical protein
MIAVSKNNTSQELGSTRYMHAFHPYRALWVVTVQFSVYCGTNMDYQKLKEKWQKPPNVAL